MKIAVLLWSPAEGRQVKFYPSINTAAKELQCNPRHISSVLKGTRDTIATQFGLIEGVTTDDGNSQTDSATGTVREHTNCAQENPTVGIVASGGGWGGAKQALVQAASAVQRRIRQFFKP